MAHISWRDEFSGGVALIDQQHQNFFGILDAVYDCFSSLHSEIEMKGILEKLSEYTEVHFGTEEEYFDTFHCEGIDEEEHRQKHQEFREKVTELKRRYSEGQTDLIADVADLMENWFLQHIMIHDKKYAACFKAHGLM